MTTTHELCNVLADSLGIGRVVVKGVEGDALKQAVIGILFWSLRR